MKNSTPEETSSNVQAASPAPQTSGPLSFKSSFQARYKNLEKVCKYVGQYARACGLDDSAIYAVQLAVDEAFSNIVEHACGGECDQEIDCTCLVTDEGLTVILEDYGEPFNPLEIPEPNFNTELEERTVGGLGLYFIHHLMDEVNFTFIPPKGLEPGRNILKMVKRKEKAI